MLRGREGKGRRRVGRGNDELDWRYLESFGLGWMDGMVFVFSGCVPAC